MFINYVDYAESRNEFKEYLKKLDYYGLDGFDILKVPSIIIEGQDIDINDMYYRLNEIYANKEYYFEEHDFDENRFHQYNDEFRTTIGEFIDYINYKVL